MHPITASYFKSPAAVSLLKLRARSSTLTSIASSVRPHLYDSLTSTPTQHPRLYSTLLLQSTTPVRPVLSCTRRPLPNLSFLARLFGFSQPSPEDMSAAKVKAQKIIDENPVAIFSKSWCPYCQNTKETFEKKYKVQHFAVEVNQVDGGDELRQAAASLNGSRTVPMIYIGGEFIGGDSDFQALSVEDVRERLEKANAKPTKDPRA